MSKNRLLTFICLPSSLLLLLSLTTALRILVLSARLQPRGFSLSPDHLRPWRICPHAPSLVAFKSLRRLSLLLLACHVIPVLNVSRKILSNSKLPFAPNRSLIWGAWTRRTLSSLLWAQWGPGALLQAFWGNKKWFIFSVSWGWWWMAWWLDLVSSWTSPVLKTASSPGSSSHLLEYCLWAVDPSALWKPQAQLPMVFFLAGSSSQGTALTLLLYHCVQWCQFGPLFK